MEIEELLVAIGVDTSQAGKIKDVVVALGVAATQIAQEANKANSTLDGIGERSVRATEQAGKKAEEAARGMTRLKMLAVGVGAVIGFVSGKVMGFLDSAIAGAKSLAQEKGLLFSISQQELQQADAYQAAMKKTGLSIESIKTKIALNLVPQLTAVVKGFNNWLGANKVLITDGLTKVIQWGGKFFQVIINTGRAISKVIDSTIGWKGAIAMLAAAFVYLNRTMLMNPIAWVIAGIIGLMLLIDDLMVYLDGGDSLFGDFWGACIGWIRKVKTWWEGLSGEFRASLKLIGAMLASTFGTNLFLAVTKGAGLFGKAVRFLLSPLGSLIKVVGAAGRAFLWLGRALLMNPIGIVIGLIAGLGYVLYDLYKWLTTGESAFGNFWQVVTDTWVAIKRAFSDGVKDILMSLGLSEEGAIKVVDAIGEVFGLVFDLITLPFSRAWEIISGLFGIWGDDTKTFTDKLGDTFSLVTELIKKPFKEAFDWITSTYDATIGKIKGAWKGLKEMAGFGDDETVDVTARAGEFNQLIQSVVAAPENPNAVMGSAVSNTTHNNRTEIKQGDMKVTQTITTSDPVRAGQVAADGVSREFARASRNLEGVFSR